MSESPHIYVDVLFLINFLMDYVILWATARLAQIHVQSLRLVLAASIGALYSIVLLLPDLAFMTSIWMKFFVSLLILVLTFIPLSWKRFGQVFLYFYLISFTMGGAMLGFIYLVTNISVYSVFTSLPIPYLWLAVALGTAILLGKWGAGFLQRSFLQGLLRVPVKIKIQGQEVAVNGLVDTGNQLVDPLTGAPVVIVEYEILAPFLPSQVKNMFGTGGEVDLEKLTRSFTEQGQLLPFRLIPFTTIGKHHGMLVGFRPDEICVLAGDQKIRTSHVIVGIYSRRLSPRGTYRALLHPSLLHASISP